MTMMKNLESELNQILNPMLCLEGKKQNIYRINKVDKWGVKTVVKTVV